MKKAMLVLLAAVVLLGALPVAGLYAGAIPASGPTVYTPTDIDPPTPPPPPPPPR